MHKTRLIRMKCKWLGCLGGGEGTFPPTQIMTNYHRRCRLVVWIHYLINYRLLWPKYQNECRRCDIFELWPDWIIMLASLIQLITSITHTHTQKHNQYILTDIHRHTEILVVRIQTHSVLISAISFWSVKALGLGRCCVCSQTKKNFTTDRSQNTHMQTHTHSHKHTPKYLPSLTSCYLSHLCPYFSSSWEWLAGLRLCAAIL